MDSKSKEKWKADSNANFSTFPLANTEKIEKNSRVTLPSEDDVDEVKDWVDFKEM